ncbi:VOC family protein [Gryllotalpicola reticulitermitis]|uniref:VOC family protein n=1 Tax=Gryllotalpicola reticulitermitis TaxID=1184153 RepID=A0ABV8Q7F9_9MICO
MSERGTLHHIELRVRDLDGASAGWGWLLGQLGYEPYQEWGDGRSWRLGATYLVIERAPMAGEHDRRMPGLSHLAFHAGTRRQVDELWEASPAHGWSHLYADRHPWAGGTEHYAAYLENAERFKVELVAAESLD